MIYYGHNVPNKRGSPGTSSALRWFDMKLILGSSREGGGDPIGWNLPAGNEPQWEKPETNNQGTNIGGKNYLLFNLSSDPFERNEISYLFPNITITMSHMLRQFEGNRKKLSNLNFWPVYTKVTKLEKNVGMRCQLFDSYWIKSNDFDQRLLFLTNMTFLVQDVLQTYLQGLYIHISFEQT